jgi:hypothetical protein
MAKASFVRSHDPVIFPPEYPTVLGDSTSGINGPDIETHTTHLAYIDHTDIDLPHLHTFGILLGVL